ncbi:type II toxin-antitoxin system VapC family toxin [Martelella sp. HB161492]|uniref:PIN domain-containing protein n=1 Tax=Martelella sp. HB161492 TaxID=2720726 RepID=UPI00159174BD
MIFVDTNVVSESLRREPDRNVQDWLIRHDGELALSSVVIAEIAFGIEKIRPDERAHRLAEGLSAWRGRFHDRLFAFTEDAAIAYGEIMGQSIRNGRPMSVPDGMIAAIALVNGGILATRNLKDFSAIGIKLLSPWTDR